MAAGDQYVPPNPTSPPIESDLLAVEMWHHLALVRERALHDELMSALRAGERSGRDEHDLWNDCFILGQKLVEAHVHRLRMEAFLDAIDKVRGDVDEEPLRLLCVLYAVEHAPHSHASHLAAGSLTAEEISAIPQTINTLCERLAPHALTLVDAFQLPTSLLNAPIAEDTYADFFSSSAE
jgi:acyl-CoA oxidase